MEDRKQVFLRKVTEHIQSKEAKKYVSDELDHHVNELRREWKGRGYSDEEAEEKAIEQMGSPAKMGMELNKIHRPRIDWLLIGLLLSAFGLGFLPLLNMPSSDVSLQPAKQAVYVTLGAFVALLLMLFDYRKLKNYGILFYVGATLFLIVLRFVPVTSMVNGIPFIRVGPLTLECVMAVPLYLLAIVSFFNSSKFKLWHFLVVFLFPAFLLLIIPSVSSAFLYCLMVMIMFFHSHFTRKTVYRSWGIGAVLVVILVRALGIPEWKEKMMAVLHPEKDPNGTGYMPLRFKELLSNAGWFGQPVSKEWIAGAQTDFVFVALTYSYGWLFAIVLVTILTLLALRMVIITRQIGDVYGRLLLIGAIALYSAQLIVNIAISLGLFPITSMSLPFISYGLTPTVINSFLIGIGLSVYRRKDITPRTIQN